MTVSLWPHQVKAFNLVRGEFQKGHKWVCLVMATGSGKTVTGVEFAKAHLAKTPGGKVLWICHRDELIGQGYDSLAAAGLSCGVIQANPSRPVNPFRPVQVASVQTLTARSLYVENVSLYIYDECFVAGTLIDGKPIEQIKLGDTVGCFDHTRGVRVERRVARLFTSRPTGLVRVNGLVCTPNHPFFVPGEGYVEARNLKGKWILRSLRRTGAYTSQDLWGGMSEGECFEANGEYKSSSFSAGVPPRTDVGRAQPDEYNGDADQNVGDTSAYWAPAIGAWWKWTANPNDVLGSSPENRELGIGILRCVGQGLAGSRAVGSLQDRHRNRGSEVGNRSGWGIARSSGSTGPGPEEGSLFDLERVDNIEILEPGIDGTYGGLCRGGLVYNLEVEEHHNYFANGVLVHNCHHGVSALWSEHALQYKRIGIYGVGLTATPMRADNLPLGDIYDSIVCPVSMRELIDQGFLVPYELVRPPKALKKGQIAQSPLTAYQKHAAGRKTIVFAANIVAATLFRDQFRSAGITSEIITGALDAGTRREILERYKAGGIQVLCNVGVLTEGFDDRPTSCIIIARSVGSVALYIQMFGRGLRTFPGKTNAILIDLYGSSWKHGPPDEERIYDLEGDGIRRKNVPMGPERFCVVCGVLMEADASVCPECGKQSPGQLAPEIMNIALVKYAYMRAKPTESRVSDLRRWIIEAGSKGYKDGWAMHRYKVVFGEWPPKDVVNQARHTGQM